VNGKNWIIWWHCKKNFVTALFQANLIIGSLDKAEQNF